MPNNLRLLVCSPGIPHESEGASVVLFFQYIAALKRAGFQVLNVLLLESGRYSEAGLSEYITKMETAGTFEVFPCVVDRFFYSGLFNIALNRKGAAQIQEKAKQFDPDAVFCLDLLSAWMLHGFDAPKVVWLGDLNFQTHLYHAWYGTLENPLHFTAIPLAWIQSKTWKRIYRRVLQPVSSVIVSADSAREQLRRIGVRSKYEPYPWPNNATAQANSDRALIPTFLFFGTLTALGSRSAFHFIISSLYPLLVRLWGPTKFEILICGSRGLPDWVAKALAGKPELKYLGFVDDIDQIMARSHGVLVPIDVPVGNRSRILTALAKGRLVIAHKNAALGNPDLTDGDNCFLAATAEEFADRLRRSVDCPDEVQAIVANGLRTYNTRFHPQVATSKIIGEIKRVARGAELMPADICHAKS